MKTKLMLLLFACAGAGSVRADFNPVALTPGSYTYDIVVESNTVQALPYCINVTAGDGTGMGDNTYYEQGMVSRAGQVGGNSGIPIHNTVFTNINSANMTFLMPPTYATNNDLMIDSTFGSGTFYFNTATTATNLAILGTGGGGTTTIGYTVTHADSSTETGSLTYQDWFNGGSTVAWGANGRIDKNGNYNNYNSSGVNNNAPYLYANKIPVSGASPIVSISFTFNSGAHANLFAVSGNAAGANWTPVPLSGFNVMAVVPAAFPLTATMDQGTNTIYNGSMDTWFEQGYYTNNLSYGLPPSGSTFNSLSQPTHHYQMGNYSANNSILIDANHLAANITPAAPAAYSSFAFLTAGGYIGSGTMTNICILQHQDGVNETNLFYGYDWYNSSIAPAFVANGRINMANRTFNTIGGGNPKLFESFFVLTDTASPVTNILVQFGASPGGSATTYIMAVSASSGGVPPLVTAGALPAAQTWFPSQNASLTVQVSGSTPITNTWLVQKNGAYVPLSDGVDANGSTISGSTTTTLTISGLTLADAVNYEYIGANAFGTSTSAPAAIYIKGQAGVVPISGWTNIDNANYSIGSSTTIVASNGVTAATLTLSDGGVNNAWSSGITGDGAAFSLMNGYIDAGMTGGIDAIATISGLTDSSYDVYLYCFGDNTRPANSGDGLPNYTVNGTAYYAPLLGANGSSTYNSTSTSVGGHGFTGFVPATTSAANDFNADLSPASFGNYIKIASVTAVGGQITIQAEADSTSYRSPLNGIEIVSTSQDGQDFGIHFLGNTSDSINATPFAPAIVSQSPTSSYDVLTNHADTTQFSVNVSPSSAAPLFYQWYTGAGAIPGATNSSYLNYDTNSLTLYCIVTNFVGSATSAPVSVTIFSRPALSAYQSAVFAYHPVAYWPLSETSGSIAFDYAGTNDGIYNGTNVLGQPGIPASAGLGVTTSVGFDGVSAYVEVPVGDLNITNALTLIEWVQPPSGGDTGFTTPLGHGDDSYRLDVAGGQAHFADAGPDVVSPLAINDGNWHQLIGVYDGTNQYLYVDGKPSGTPQPGTSPGNTGNVRIGGAPDYGNRFFAGNIAQVAILTNALSAAEVAAVYSSVGNPPTVSITPANPSVYAGSGVTFTAHLGGGVATSLQWFQIDTSSVSNNIPGATNLTYTIASTSVTQDGYTYGVVAANAYGAAVASVPLAVQNGPAYLGTDISPLLGEAYAGAPVTYSVGAAGSLPISYQWQVDGLPVAGGTNATLTLPAPCGIHTIQVSFTNAQNGGVPITSSQATLQGDANPTNITFFNDGTGWTISPATYPNITGNVLTLTDGKGNEAATAFYNIPQYVGRFHASFVYTGNGSADGAAFIIQNSSSGVLALGGGGGGLGYAGISNSLALEINLYSTPGIAPGTNGITFGSGGGPAYEPTGPINVASGDPIQFTLDWADGVLNVSMLDTTTLAAFTTNYVYGSISSLLNGDLGYVGFSGGTGGLASIQTISDFAFNSVITPMALSVSPLTSHSFRITWPAADPNFGLQQATSLTSPSWTAGPVPVVVGGMNQVTIDVTAGAPQQYYRLVRSVSCP